MNDKLKNKLFNWRFTDAMLLCEDVDDKTWDVVSDLYRRFGNVGWFSGTAGDEINELLDSINVFDNEEEQ